MAVDQEPGETLPDTRARGCALRALPVLLVALGGACGVSAVLGFVCALSGRRAPLLLLLAPPALVLLVAPLRFLARDGR